MKTLYKNKGYVVIPDIFTPKECDEIISWITPHTNKEFQWLYNLELKEPKMISLVKDDRIIKIAKSILGEDIIIYGSQIIFKKPGTVYAEESYMPHQDNAYHLVEKGSSISVMLALEDINKTNGGLFIYPKSHNEDVLPYTPKETDPLKKGKEIVNIPSKYKKVFLSLKKGDIYVQHDNLIHGSVENKSNRWRPIVDVLFTKKGYSYHMGETRKSIDSEYRKLVEL